MNILVIYTPINIEEVARLAKKQFGNFIKGTVDVKKHILALGGELHADEEQLLLEQGSSQTDLWGINLYPSKFGSADFIEFDSMINLRPSQGNMSLRVEDPKMREHIKETVNTLIIKGKK